MRGQRDSFDLQERNTIDILQHMGKFFSLLLVAAVAILLNSCVCVNTHRACADRGRQYQAVILPDQENLVIYQHHGKLYLQGILTSVRREGRDKVSHFMPNDFSSGRFVPIAGAPQCHVYRQLTPADVKEDDVFGIQPGQAIPAGAYPVKQARQVTGYTIDSLNCNPTTTQLQHGWQRELPKHARRYYGKMVTSEHQNAGTHLCNTRRGFVIPVTPARTNKHAWYAYPLAALSFVCIDVPGSLLANTAIPLVYGIAAIPCSIYEFSKRTLVEPGK